MSNLPGSTISPLLEAHPDELILFSTNEQKTIRKTTRDESGWMDLGDYYVNSLSICRSSDFTKPAYVVLKDHIPTGRPYKVVGSILSVESLRNEHDSLSIHWQTTNVAHYNRHMLYVTTFKTSTLSEKYLIMWNGLALEQRRCSVRPVPAFEQRSHDDEAVVASTSEVQGGICPGCKNTEQMVGEVCHNCGLTFVVEGDISADDSRTEEDELSDDDSSVDKSLELLTHSVTGVDIGSNGDSDDEEEEEQHEYSQLYPDEHDYKDLGEMMFKK
jgi:hypothetical protein